MLKIRFGHRASASSVLRAQFVNTTLRELSHHTNALGRAKTGYRNKGYCHVLSNMRSSAARSQEGVKAGGKATNRYSDTVILPSTTFNQRANAVVREPEIQQWWKDKKIFEKTSASNEGGMFTLHDGPPYANGDLHIGHALNKILKDFIVRYQLLRGKKVRYTPGWDTHGLPIELKVLQGMKSKDREALTPITLRKHAAQFAMEAMEKQRVAFQRYGVWGDWENPYLTLQPEYEAAQIRVFGDMLARGHIYRGKRPVHWSPSSGTALAEAELEYPDNHVSKSIYLAFRVERCSAALAAAVNANPKNQPPPQPQPQQEVRVAVWTTTPWTIPANLAVAVNPDMEYCLASHPDAHAHGGAKFLVATALVDSFGERLGLTAKGSSASASSAAGAEAGAGAGAGAERKMRVEHIFKGSDLVGTEYTHPLYPERKCKIVAGGDYINTSSGTGLVHTAPGHGAEDYQTGLKHGLPLLSPVNDKGCFTDEAGPRFAGLDVLGAGNTEVIAALAETGLLIKVENYPHKYPYDWRTKKPTIFRATEQWFASISTFRHQALAAIDKVDWIPASGRNRIFSMVENRGDWCISRQRSWGVPLPVFYSKATGEALVTPEILSHIEALFRENGSNCWWELPIEQLLPQSLRHLSEQYTKGTDTMDVWFDSGTSWAGVLLNDTFSGGKGGKQSTTATSTTSAASAVSNSPQSNAPLSYPADLYLEGSDQHRGWFQSSLLTSVASRGVAPYKQVLTHGFVLDEKGLKMSKSVGNVVDPRTVIEGGSNQKTDPAYGADTLRLWISSVDYTGDVCVGDNIMKQAGENYRKIRNTLRYLVGSLTDFKPETDCVPYDQLPSIDRYILGRLSATVSDVQAAYDAYHFYKAHQSLLSFISFDLSAFYLDIAKDRLYISSRDDPRRRTCQTVIYRVMEQLTVVLAPLLPHLAEDLWQNRPYYDSSKSSSVFEQSWPRNEHAINGDSSSDSGSGDDTTYWTAVRSIRNDVNKCIERMRTAKLVGASPECQVVLFSKDAELSSKLRSMQGDSHIMSSPVSTDGQDDLRFVLLCSQVTVVTSEEAFYEALAMRRGAQHAATPAAHGQGQGQGQNQGQSLTTEAESEEGLDYMLAGSESESGLLVGVAKAAGCKCNRCWYYSTSVGHGAGAGAQDDAMPHSDLCLRCVAVLRADNHEVAQ